MLKWFICVWKRYGSSAKLYKGQTWEQTVLFQTKIYFIKRYAYVIKFNHRNLFEHHVIHYFCFYGHDFFFSQYSSNPRPLLFYEFHACNNCPKIINDTDTKQNLICFFYITSLTRTVRNPIPAYIYPEDGSYLKY